MSEVKFGNNFSSIKFGNNRKVIFYIAPGRLSDWRYSEATNGQITLYEYTARDWANTVYVPVSSGKTVINNYTSGTTTTASNTPFFNNPNAVSVDLQSVPFVSNNMYRAFNNCRNLVSVKGINQNVTSMSWTFFSCTSLNQNVQIPNSVTNMFYTFWGCLNLNQNIQIPNSVTNMHSTFSSCTNLNQNIQIPNSVTNMVNTFYGCNDLQGTINILSNQITDVKNCFYGTSLPKNVYIPFKYSNGVNSATFNSFVSAGYLYANGVSNNQHGVTMYNLSSGGGSAYDDGGEDDYGGTNL